MSQEIHLNVDDYDNIARWYELAFSKKNNSTKSDDNTLTKISVMGLSYLEELKELEKNED